MTDDVIETIIGLGEKELSIYEASRICPSLIVQDFDDEEAILIVKKMFEMLLDGFENVKCFVPSDVFSNFENYMFWIRKELTYKIGQFLKNKD